MVTLAAQPGGFERTAIAPVASATGLSISAGSLLQATPDALSVDLGPGARLSARFDARREWPRRPFGALGPAQVVPWLGQYWSPWLLDARVSGATDFGLSLAGCDVYAEKNWGGAFAEHWWWGQAPGARVRGRPGARCGADGGRGVDGRRPGRTGAAVRAHGRACQGRRVAAADVLITMVGRTRGRGGRAAAARRCRSRPSAGSRSARTTTCSGTSSYVRPARAPRVVALRGRGRA